jgi:S1-C subfamily serine protease
MVKLRNLLRIGFFSFMMGCCTNITDVTLKTQQELENTPALKQKLIVEKLRQSTVAIVLDVSGVKLPMCSGIWVSQNLILTAAHCIDTEKLVYEYSTVDDYNKEKTKKATVVGIEEDVDLALLFAPVDGVQHPIAIMSSDVISTGDAVHVVGHPAGYAWTYTHGYVGSVRDSILGPSKIMNKIVQISAPIWLGNSGGGAFDTDGNLIGVCSWISKSGPQLSFFVHKDIIEEFMIRQLSKIN